MQKMISVDDVTKENIKENYSNQPQIHDDAYRILLIGGSGSEKLNSLFNLINEEPDIDKVYLYAKDQKHQFLINKIESRILKHFNDSTAFIEYTQIIWMIFIKT